MKPNGRLLPVSGLTLSSSWRRALLALTVMDVEERDPSTSSVRATAPFDDERADIIFRSSDGVDFRVHKLILSLASPFFTDMFAFPQPSPASHPDICDDNHPLIQISEPSSVLNALLRLLYPVVPAPLTDLPDIRALLEALIKYDLDSFIHSGHIASALNHVAPADPIGVFALAVRFNLEDAAQTAARCSLCLPMLALDSPSLSQIPASSYRALSKYHLVCSDTAYSVASSRTWFVPVENALQRGKLPCGRCWKPDAGVHLKSGWVARGFVWRYLELALFALSRQPHGSAISTKEDVGPFDVSGKERVCSLCASAVPAARPVLEVFSQMLADKVDEAVRDIPTPKFVS